MAQGLEMYLLKSVEECGKNDMVRWKQWRPLWLAAKPAGEDLPDRDNLQRVVSRDNMAGEEPQTLRP